MSRDPSRPPPLVNDAPLTPLLLGERIPHLLGNLWRTLDGRGGSLTGVPLDQADSSESRDLDACDPRGAQGNPHFAVDSDCAQRAQGNPNFPVDSAQFAVGSAQPGVEVEGEQGRGGGRAWGDEFESDGRTEVWSSRTCVEEGAAADSGGGDRPAVI